MCLQNFPKFDLIQKFNLSKMFTFLAIFDHFWTKKGVKREIFGIFFIFCSFLGCFDPFFEQFFDFLAIFSLFTPLFVKKWPFLAKKVNIFWNLLALGSENFGVENLKILSIFCPKSCQFFVQKSSQFFQFFQFLFFRK